MHLLLVAALNLAPTPPSEPPKEAVVEPDNPQRVFYGWQNIAVEYGGAMLFVHGAFSGSTTIAVTGAATWAFGGAVVHALHGRTGAAIASPFLVAGVPLALAGLGAASGGRHDGETAAAGLFLLGAIVMPLVDGLVLGYEAPRVATTGVGLAPMASRDAIGLVAGGLF